MFERTRRAGARALHRMSAQLSSLADRINAPPWHPSAEQRRVLAANAALKDLHRGRPGFVIGNGPSLAGQDLRPLAGQVTFVANGFWRHPLMAEAAQAGANAWQPTYYSIVDPLYFDGSPAMADCFETIRQRVLRATFLVPLRFLGEVHRQGLLDGDRVRVCLFRGGFTHAGSPACDLTGPLPHPPSVSVVWLLAALYTGCNPIYLLGMDHDWLSRPVIRCEHFYHQVSVANHPEFEAIERGGAQTYLDNLEGLTGLYRAYHCIAELADEMGVAIYNATDGGYLDVYPRLSYEHVLDELEGVSEATEQAARHPHLVV